MIAGIIRKSPTKSVEESIEVQKKAILDKIKIDFPNQNKKVKWFIDICKGDDPKRKQLQKLFQTISQYEYAYCYNVDRFSRSWLGLKWLHQYFMEDSKNGL